MGNYERPKAQRARLTFCSLLGRKHQQITYFFWPPLSGVSLFIYLFVYNLVIPENLVSRAPSSTKNVESWHSRTRTQLFRSVQSDLFNQAWKSPRAPMLCMTEPEVPTSLPSALVTQPTTARVFSGSLMNCLNSGHCMPGCGAKLHRSFSFHSSQRKTLNKKLRDVSCIFLRGAEFTPPAHLLYPVPRPRTTPLSVPQINDFSSFHEP